MFCIISVGMTSATSVATIQPSNAKKQRSLPKYDWSIEMVNVTPCVTRIFHTNHEILRERNN